MMQIKPALLALLMAAPLSAQAAPCGADPALGLTAADAQRLERLLDSRHKGRAAAAGAADPAGAATMADFYGRGIGFADALPAGAYDCRTVKLGGPFGAFTPYGWFRCQVSETGIGLGIVKLSGSQRFIGHLSDVGGGLVFKGVSYYGDEEPGSYGDDPEKDEVACLSRKAPGEEAYLLEFPEPLFESDHDVIELRPAR